MVKTGQRGDALNRRRLARTARGEAALIADRLKLCFVRTDKRPGVCNVYRLKKNNNNKVSPFYGTAGILRERDEATFLCRLISFTPGQKFRLLIYQIF